jgi:release factor glutamine methyltransferase
MDVQEALRRGRHLIATISDEADLEAELLLAHALKTDRIHLYQRLQEPLPPRQESVYHRLLERRLRREPTPYIIGRKEFYGLQLEVTPAAIIPRPETELVVETALAEARRLLETRPSLAIADVGSGSGAIALALTAGLPGAEVIATDTSARALALARRNADRLGQRIRFLRGDLLRPLEGPVDIIATNLPYVKSDDWRGLPPEIRDYEPRRGLDGGPTGLRAIKRLLRQAPPYLKPGGALVLEIGDDQAQAVRRTARQHFPRAHIEVRQDLAGLDRVTVIRL